MNRTVLMAAVAASLVSASGMALSNENAKRGTEATGTTAPKTSQGAVTSTPDRTQSMERLMQAAQRLREAIQAMAQQSPGEARNRAIETAREALFETQQAMIDLPPELRTKSGSQGESDYAKSMDKLKQAAQRLRESAQAMAQQPAGERRNQAIEQINGAILEINQAMVQLPWQPSASAGKQRAASSPFDQIDKNRDGMISREEYKQHTDATTSRSNR